MRLGSMGGQPVTLMELDSFGQARVQVGGINFTITLNAHVAVLLHASIAVQETWLVPGGKNVPEAVE